MRIAVAQMGSRPGEFEATSGRMLAQADAASGRDAELIVFGAPVLTGASAAGLEAAPEFFLECSRALERIASRIALPAVVPSLLCAADGLPYRECVCMHDGRVVPMRLTRWVADGNDPRDATAEALSAEPMGFSIAGVSFGVALDEHDLESVRDGRDPLECLLYLPFDGFSTDDEASVLGPCATRCFSGVASSLGAWVVGVGANGAYGERVFCGGSFVLTPWNELACSMPCFEEGLGVCDVDPASEGPLAGPVPPGEYRRVPFLWDALVLALRGRLTGTDGVRPAIVALDGGLASSLVATLAVDAVGPLNVSALVVTDAGDGAVSDARRLAENLRLATRDVPSAAVAAVAMDGLASSSGGVALGSVDKTALALEPAASRASFGSYAPLGDVYRTDLIALLPARQGVSPVFPDGVHSRYRVPDLATIGFAGITSESRVNAVDAMLLLSVEQGMPLDDVVLREGHATLVEEVVSRLRACARDRLSLPEVAVVSQHPIADLAWPVDLAWQGRAHAAGASDSGDGGFSRLSACAREEVNFGIHELTALHSDDKADAMELLRDAMANDVLRNDQGDIWGSGLFSDN